MKSSKIALGGGNYNTPEIKVVEIFPEGVLCESDQEGSGSFGDLNPDGGDIFNF